MLKPTTLSTRNYARTVNRIGWALVIFLGLFYAFEVMVTVFFPSGGETPVARALYGLISSIAYMAPFLLAGWIFYAISRKRQTQRIRFEIKLPPAFPLLIFAGLAINFAAAYANSWMCQLIGYTIPDDWLMAPNYDNPGSIILYMTVALAPAFSEEFLFRGVIYGNLRPYGRTQAVLISAMLFSLMHQNLAQTFYTFICGIVMALMYEYTGSIWCSIFFHMLNNELSVLSEILYYGNYGEIALYMVSWMDIVIFVVGGASIVILALLAYRQKKQRAGMTRHGVFGSPADSIEASDRPLSARATWRLLCAPGMIVYVAMTVLSMLFTYLMVILLYMGG